MTFIAGEDDSYADVIRDSAADARERLMLLPLPARAMLALPPLRLMPPRY